MQRTAIFLACLGFFISRADAAAPPGPAQIDAAIEAGKKAIYALQKDNGTWDIAPPAAGAANTDISIGQWGGQTAMAVYALVVCGEKPTDPKLQKAIDFLQTANITGTYAVSVKCLVWQHLPPTPAVKKAMARDAHQLIIMAHVTKAGLPVWDYGPKPTPGNTYSLSRTQYATLGIWAASEMGIESPPAFWKSLENTWEKSQTPSGGWEYRFTEDDKGTDYAVVTVGMTAAALASLYVTQDFTKGDYYANAHGNASSEPIERGLKWLTENFDARVAQPKMLPREFPYAQLYALERVGLASGLRRFGDHDWYAVGSQFLLSRLSKNGWGDGGVGSMPPLTSNCWAILFLQRGQTPVAFNKLDYSAAVPDAKKALWNQRPRDIANLTSWLSDSMERALRWQIVSTSADAGDFLEAPVLYISGAGAANLNDAAKAKLKSYVEQGGLILAHADVSDTVFAKSMTDLGKSFCPQSEWRDLPPTHPVFANQNFKSLKNKVRGIGNGVREWMLLLPSGDYAKAWQQRSPKQKKDQWEIGANVLSYADGGTFFSRGYSWLMPESTAASKRKVTIGRLKYDGNWDPEPQAFTQLGRYTLANGGTQIEVVPVAAGDGIDPAKIDLLYVTGTAAFQLTDAARDAIKKYAGASGTVMFESAGGGADFAASAEGELTKIFGGKSLTLLPPKSAMFSADYKAEYRTFKMETISNPLAPQLRGIEQGGRTVALLSHEDISAGLLGVPTDGIVGYTPQSAKMLMAGLIASLKK